MSKEQDNQKDDKALHIGDVMMRLSDLGWESRFDSWLTFNKKIHDFNLCVHKHIDSKKWSCTLIDYVDNEAEEVTISYDAKLEWVLALEKLLLNAS